MQLTHRQSTHHAIKTNVNKILPHSPWPPRTSATTSTELRRGIEEEHKQEGRRSKVSREGRRKINVVRRAALLKELCLRELFEVRDCRHAVKELGRLFQHWGTGSSFVKCSWGGVTWVMLWFEEAKMRRCILDHLMWFPLHTGLYQQLRGMLGQKQTDLSGVEKGKAAQKGGWGGHW